MKSQLLGLLRHRFARKPARSCDWHVAFVLDFKIKYQKPKKLIGIGFWLKLIYILKRILSIEVLIQWGNSTNKQKITLERKVSFTNRPPPPPPCFMHVLVYLRCLYCICFDFLLPISCVQSYKLNYVVKHLLKRNFKQAFPLKECNILYHWSALWMLMGKHYGTCT